MTKVSLPQLGMDGVLCDRPQDGCFIGGKRNYARDSISKKETKMAHVMTNQEVQSNTKKLVTRLLGQDSAVDDETAARIKGFLESRLSPGDHAQACKLIDGDPEAEDDLPENATVRLGGAAADARAAFDKQFPDAARTRVDNSGLQPRRRAASYSAADAASFAAMFPDAARIKVL